MKKYWLRGVLLAMGMALLLAGCVDKDCIPCYDGLDVTAQEFMVPDEYLVNLSATGIDEQMEYCATLSREGDPVGRQCDEAGVRMATGSFFVTCDPPTFFLDSDIPGSEPFSGRVPDYRGVWSLRVSAVGASSDGFIEWLVEWLVADECEEEFVPEPGTMMLLGSGLLGLAGYATLRWRRRE